MAKDYRTIRLNQPSMTSKEMRAQLVKNRSDYAKRQQTPEAKALKVRL